MQITVLHHSGGGWLHGEPLRRDDAVWPAIHASVTLTLQGEPVRVLVPEVTS